MEFKGWRLAYLKSMDTFKPGLTLKINHYEYKPSCLLCQLTWIIRLKVSDSFFFSSSALDRERICSCILQVSSSPLVVTWMAGVDKLGTWISGSTIQKKYHKWNKTFLNSDWEKKVIFFFLSSMYVVKIRVFGKISKNFFVSQWEKRDDEGLSDDVHWVSDIYSINLNIVGNKAVT